MKTPTDEYRDEDYGAGPAFAADLEALHRVSVPDLHTPAAMTPPRRHRHLSRMRPVAAMAAVAAGVALFIGGSSLWGGDATEVSAETILQRTAGVAKSNALTADTPPYHIVARNQATWDGAGATTVDTEMETWYRDPSHLRTESRETGGGTTSGNTQSGNDVWLYATRNGDTAAVHASIDELGIRMGQPMINEQADDLADLLELYSGGGCSSAKFAGEEEVAGRDTYVIEVAPTPDTCPMKVTTSQDGSKTTVESKAPAGGPGAGDAKSDEPKGKVVMFSAAGKASATTKMWVDKETSMTLKSETYSEGELVFRYEVTQFETNVELADSLFQYEPPTGVEVVEAHSPTEMKQALSGQLGAISVTSSTSEPLSIEKGVTDADGNTLPATSAGGAPVAP